MYLEKRPAARSVYLRQVEQIFPFQLVGREAELAELAAFCTEPGARPYTRWQGPAWAGKSALLAWFVQHPPAGVRLVSFFITARFAGQSDRTAFLDVVLEQLAEAAEQPVPDALTDSSKQAWFIQLLADAAAICANSNQRLVLLIDGLDEDRGVTSGTEPHSIAALLPADPPAGVRVIVAGRPDPPVPADVPAWHPLRDETIVRRLAVSPHAQMIRDDAERELDYLLDDQGVGRRLLGLVTVAGGGLSLDDLVELSEESPRAVDRTLRSVLGRTFRGRLNRWRTAGPPVFVLAHEELQQSAAKGLSRRERDYLLGQLHAWADRYRDQGWPPRTPEYLLRGYHRLLVASGDIARMTSMATDDARLERMLDVSGGDTEAVAEITAVQEYIGGECAPDLPTLLNLAITRDRLVRRNETLPSQLAVTWVKLGYPARGEALARSITSKYAKAAAIADVAAAMAERGDLSAARPVIRQAEVAARSTTDPESRAVAFSRIARALVLAGDVSQGDSVAAAITDPGAQGWALIAIAEAAAAAGDVERARRVIQQAEVIVRSLADPGDQGMPLGRVAAVLAQAGDADQAERIAGSIARPSFQAQALAGAGQALASAGDLGRARPLIQRAEDVAGTVTDPYPRVHALAGAASALVAAGDVDRAREVIRRAQTAAGALTDAPLLASALARVAEVLASAGDIDQAEEVARSIATGLGQAQALAHVAEALAAAGAGDRARQVMQRAETAARSGSNPVWRDRTLIAVTKALAMAGATAQAEAVACSVAGPAWRAEALVSVTGALAAAGDVDRARPVIRQAEADARSCNAFWQGSALAKVSKAWAEVGDADQAGAAARDIPAPAGQAEALADVAEALVRAGKPAAAETIARAITDISYQAQALAGMAVALAEAGDADRARELVQQASVALGSIADPYRRATVLARAARALAQSGDVGQAGQLVRQAEMAARPLTDIYEQGEAGSEACEALVQVTRALVRAGDGEQAEATARSIGYQYQQAEALASVAAALAGTGDIDRAEAIAHSVEDPHCQATILAACAAALSQRPDATGPPENPVISATPAGQRLQRLLAAILAQPSNYLAALPLLARIQPATLIRAAEDIAGHTGR
jgi:tetratricopeptide (TPR) repeat protein